MSLSHPSELHVFLKEIGVTPNKRLSQSFLIDENIVKKIVSAADVKNNDWVLEIGPGPGALTDELLKRGAQVIAVEKDRRLAASLAERHRGKQLHVYNEDFLTFSLYRLPSQTKVKVVANLPYHISTPILEKICESDLFSTATIMIQKELAERAIAKPKTSEMSSFTIFLQTYAEVKIEMQVSRHCFYPAPQVDSCVVKMHFHPPLMAHPESFLIFVRKAFGQRRKMLRSSLGITDPRFATLRPEMLSFDEWLELYRTTAK